MLGRKQTNAVNHYKKEVAFHNIDHMSILEIVVAKKKKMPSIQFSKN